MKNRKFFSLLLLLSATGLALALLLTHHHMLLTFGWENSFAFCRKGCDTVNASSYSELYGIPVSSYGAVAYSSVLLLAFLGFFLAETSLSPLLFSLAFLISLGCLAASLVLAGISIFKLSSFCNLCGLTYLINLALVWGSGAALKISSGSIFGTVVRTLRELLKKSDHGKDIAGYYQKIAKFLILLILFLHALSGLAVSFFTVLKVVLLKNRRPRNF